MGRGSRKSSEEVGEDIWAREDSAHTLSSFPRLRSPTQPPRVHLLCYPFPSHPLLCLPPEDSEHNPHHPCPWTALDASVAWCSGPAWRRV